MATEPKSSLPYRWAVHQSPMTTIATSQIIVGICAHLAAQALPIWRNGTSRATRSEAERFKELERQNRDIVT